MPTCGVIPAAGSGTRLGATYPKPLVPLAGKPLIAWVVQALAPHVDELVLVVSPGNEDACAQAVFEAGWTGPLVLTAQHQPIGSADAVRRGLQAASGQRCIVCWADQVGARSSTAARLGRMMSQSPGWSVLPLVKMGSPRAWVEADTAGRVLRVGRVHDGDVAPAEGLADIGMFGIDRDSGLDALSELEAMHERGRELDFVYALPILSAAGSLIVSDIVDVSEATAVNNQQELGSALTRMGLIDA